MLFIPVLEVNLDMDVFDEVVVITIIGSAERSWGKLLIKVFEG